MRDEGRQAPIMAAWWCATLSLATTGAAQKLSVTNGPLAPGSTADVRVYDPSAAGTTVKVKIDNGGLLDPRRDWVSVELDEFGRGVTTWTVPETDWQQANFNAEGMNEVTRFISQGVRARPVNERVRDAGGRDKSPPPN